MSSKIKAVIISAIVLVLLIGAVVVLKLTENSGANDSSSSSSSSSAQVTSKLLYEEKQEDVQSVLIKNAAGEYEVTLTGKDESDNPVWGIEEFGADIPVDTSKLSSIASAVSSITTQKVIEENASDLAKYGLDAPSVEVKVTFKDSENTVVEFEIGNAAPTSGQSYFKLKGENTVYTVLTSTFSNLTKGKTAAVKTTLVEAVTEYPIIKDVSVDRADLGYSVYLAYDASLVGNEITSTAEEDYSHVMTQPIKANLDSADSTPLVRGMFGLTADSVAYVHPTQDELDAAGIGAPSALVITELEDKTYTLTIGKKDETSGNYFVKLDGVDVVYLINEGSLPWMTFDTVQLTAYMITGYNIYDLDSIKITSDTTEDFFEFVGTDNDTFVVTRNGVEMPDSSYFRTFYQYILMAPGESLWLEDPTATKADVTMTFEKKDGSIHTLEFYKVENRQSIIKFDGVTSYKCRTTYLDRLFSNLDVMDDQGEIIMTW